MMKKLLALLLSLSMTLSLTACGGGGDDKPQEPASTPDPGPAVSEPADDIPEGSLFLMDGIEPYDLSGDTLAETGWQFAGGYLDGTEMEQEEAEAVLAQYGGTLQIVFSNETNVTMIQGGGALEGTYNVMDDGLSTGILFDNNGSDLVYAAFVSDVGEQPVLFLLSDDTGLNAIYFTQIIDG